MIAEKSGRTGIDLDRVFIGLIFSERRDRAVPIISSCLTELPNLLNCHLLLGELVDDGS